MRIPPLALSGAFVAPALNFSCVVPSSNGLLASEGNISQDFDPKCYYWDQSTKEVTPCTQWEFDTSTFTSTLTAEVNFDRLYNHHLLCILQANFIIVL